VDPVEQKAAERKGKIQLIDASKLCSKMRKSLGAKRNMMSEEDIRLITRTFGDFEVVDLKDADENALSPARYSTAPTLASAA
jgi:type I restriction enzyme M protein